MSKRYGKVYDNKLSAPAKRVKLDVTLTSSQQVAQENKPTVTSKNETDDDPWGADFNDEDIEEMDFAASQASVQLSNVSDETTETKAKTEYAKPPMYMSYVNSKPSTSRSCTIGNTAEPKKFEPKIPTKLTSMRKDSVQTNSNIYGNQEKFGTTSFNSQRPCQPSQRISSSDSRKEIFKDEQSILFDDFKDNLLKVNNHNSTFQSQLINKNDDSILRQLEKLKLENQKLLNDFITKEGETAFLRNQLQQMRSRAELENAEKTRQVEEQANQYRSEINQAIKKEENLQTQLEFQTLQFNNLKERYKLLETGAIKFTEPHTASFNSPARNRLNTTLNRSSSGVKTVQVTESAVQTTRLNLRKTYRPQKTLEIYPLSEIPQSIFEPSQTEPPIVEIQIIEKVGTKSLPILQDEENVRIFENPDLIKPIVTMVNEQKLNIEFCLPDVAALMKKTDIEINGRDIHPMINKLVAVARELLLNTTLVLQRISQVIRNDDIRDMNDVYFSDFYRTHVDSSKSICDSNAWHDRERGIEARRSLAILSYLATASNYLNEYIAGKRPLNLVNDTNYENYIKQMNSYNKWPKKGCQFEMLELILEFVTTVGYVRRSHQFSGLYIAIIKLLVSLKERLINDDKGIEYIFKILREIIFGRPLLVCYSYVTELLMTYSECIQFCKQLCVGTSRTSINVWKDVQHFTPDACPMQIYTSQLEVFQLDPVTTISIAYWLVHFVSNILSLNDMPWVSQAGYPCKCSMKLFGLTLNFLYKCSKVNLEEPVERQTFYPVANFKESTHWYSLGNDISQETVKNPKTYSNTICSGLKQLDKSVKIKSQHKQLLTIKKGIMFLCYLSNRDSDFIIRSSDNEDSYNLFMQQIESFQNLNLNETARSALSSVKSTFVFDRTTSCGSQSGNIEQNTGFKNHVEVKERPSSSNRRQIVSSYDTISKNQRISNQPSWLSEFLARRYDEKTVSKHRRNAK